MKRQERAHRETCDDYRSVGGEPRVVLLGRGQPVGEAQRREIGDARPVAGQERRLGAELKLPRDVDEQRHLLRRTGKAVKCQHARRAPGDDQRVRYAFAHQRAPRTLDGARAHASPRLMPYARIFLCRFVRSTPSTTAALEMFQSSVFSVSMMYVRSAPSRNSRSVSWAPGVLGAAAGSGVVSAESSASCSSSNGLRCGSSGRSATVMTSLDKIAARSTTFFSSRTLPGNLRRASAS